MAATRPTDKGYMLRGVSPYHRQHTETKSLAKELILQLPLQIISGRAEYGSLPFARLVSALDSLSNSSKKGEQHEILGQLFRMVLMSPNARLEMYLVLKMLMPRYDNECVYGMKTRRLLQVAGAALRKMGRSDGNATLQQWLKNVPLQESILAKGRGVVCLPELVIGAQCVRASSRSSGSMSLVQVGVVCRLLTTAYLTSAPELLETAQSEIVREVIEHGGMSFQEWLVLLRILLKKVSMGVGPETVLGALNAQAFFSKQRDLARLADHVVFGGQAVVTCGVPFCPMTCHNMRSPYLMQWLFTTTKGSAVVGAKENHLVISHSGKWYVTITPANAKVRQFVNLYSDETLKTAYRRRGVLLLREFEKAGMLSSAAGLGIGYVIHYRLTTSHDETQLLLLSYSPRDASTDLMIEEEVPKPIMGAVRPKEQEWTDLVALKEAASGNKRLRVVQSISASTPKKQQLLNKNGKSKNNKQRITPSDLRSSKATKHVEEEDEAKLLVVQEKWDGDRIQIHIHANSRVELFTKWGKNVSELYSDVCEELSKIVTESENTRRAVIAPCVLDGELVVVHKDTGEAFRWSSTKWRFNDGKTKEGTQPLTTFTASTSAVIALVPLEQGGTVNNMADEEEEEASLSFASQKNLDKWKQEYKHNNNSGGREIKDGILRVILYDIIMHQGKAVHDLGCRARLALLEKELGATLKSQSRHCRVIENTRYLDSGDVLLDELRQSVGRGEEGLVIKDPMARYEFGKSACVQKLKLSGPEINTGVMGVGSSLSGNPRMCGLLTCIGWKAGGVVMSYSRVEIIEGEKPWMAIEHVMTELDSRVSVAELERAGDKGVLLGNKYAVHMVGKNVRRVTWKPVAEEDMRYACEAIIMAGDLTDVQWLVSPYECCFGLSVHGDLRPLEYDEEDVDNKKEWVWKPRHPVGRVELRDFQMSHLDTAQGIQHKYEAAQQIEKCIELHMVRRISAQRSLIPVTRKRLVEIARVLQGYTKGGQSANKVTVEGLNLLLKNAGALAVDGGETFRELTPEERLALEAGAGRRADGRSEWRTWKEKHSQRHNELKSAEDATMDAEMVANTAEWASRFKELSAQIETLQPVRLAVGRTGAYVCGEAEEDDNLPQDVTESVSVWDAMQENNLKLFDEETDDAEQDEDYYEEPSVFEPDLADEANDYYASYYMEADE